MPTGCAATACPSVWKKNCDYSFHRFPLDPERRKEWLSHLNRKNYAPSRHTFLCSKHFEDCWFDRTGQTIRLRANAVPTIFSFPENVRRKVRFPRDAWNKKTVSVTEYSLAGLSDVTPNRDPGTEHRNCEHHNSSIPEDGKRRNLLTLPICQPTFFSHSMPTSLLHVETEAVSLANLTKDFQKEHSHCEDHNYYLQSLSAAKRKIDNLEKRLEAANKKIKHCQQRERRVNTKCTKLKFLFDDLKKKNLSEESALEIIGSTLDGLSLEILRNEMNNHSKDPHGHRYSSSLIEFCITLYSYSPKAYEFIRQHLSIPHPHTLRNWVDISDGEPVCKSSKNPPELNE